MRHVAQLTPLSQKWSNQLKLLPLKHSLQILFDLKLFKKNTTWNPSPITEETGSKLSQDDELKFAVVAHVFYPEFVNVFIESVQYFPKGTDFYVSTPNPDIFLQLKTNSKLENVDAIVRLTPNRGRNFGPLLVEFSKDLKKYDSFFHVHSKKSPHAKNNLGTVWSQRFFLLLLTKKGIRRITGLAAQDKFIGLIYPDVSDLVRRINFRWGVNRAPLQKINKLKIHTSGRGQIPFPAGGMFWVRTAAILPLLDIDWSYTMFPEEAGQVDGTLQHGIERVLGPMVIDYGYRHVVNVQRLDIFTYETNY